MGPYQIVKDRLRSGDEKFEFLNGAQLVKHPFGLVTEGRRKSKRPHLVYLFAEPAECVGRRIDDAVTAPSMSIPLVDPHRLQSIENPQHTVLSIPGSVKMVAALYVDVVGNDT